VIGIDKDPKPPVFERGGGPLIGGGRDGEAVSSTTTESRHHIPRRKEGRKSISSLHGEGDDTNGVSGESSQGSHLELKKKGERGRWTL